MWIQEGQDETAWDHNTTLVLMVANVFGKDPRPLETFKPLKEED